MKKILFGVLVLSAVTLFCISPALAGQKNTGCGLGTVILGEQDGILLQLFVITTNNTFYSQTFGITSGTSNCDSPSGVVKNDRLEHFVVSNMDTLAYDIAAGQGETLETLAELLEVSNKTEFYTKLQMNFSNIYTSKDITSAQVIDNIMKVIES